MNWYYGQGDQQHGPVSEEDLISLIRQGVVGKQDLVWNSSFGDEWREAGSVPGLFAVPSATSPGPDPDTGSNPEPVPTAEIPVYSVYGSGEGFARNAEITRRAREAMRGNWGMGVAFVLIMMAISFGIGQLAHAFGDFVGVLFAGVFLLGTANFFLSISRTSNADLSQFVEPFPRFLPALLVYLVSSIFILLWSLLLILPGIVAMLSYSQIYYLMCDHPGLSTLDTLRSSKALMKGHRWQLFRLHFRFLGWYLLVPFTLFIGLLWLIPYIHASMAEFYRELRKHQKTSEVPED